MFYSNVSKANQWAANKDIPTELVEDIVQNTHNVWGITRITRGQINELWKILEARKNNTFIFEDEEAANAVKSEVKVEPEDLPELEIIQFDIVDNGIETEVKEEPESDWTVYNNDVIDSDIDYNEWLQEEENK